MLNNSNLHIKKGKEFSLSKEELAETMLILLKKGVKVKIIAKGRSMFPFIRDKDLITISPLYNKNIGLGDIVFFVHPTTGGPVFHRIIKKRCNIIYIKGDNAQNIDGCTPTEALIGRVEAIERNGRKINFGLGIEKNFIAYLSKKQIIIWLIQLFRSQKDKAASQNNGNGYKL